MDKNGKVHIGNQAEHIALLSRTRELTGKPSDPDAVREALKMLVDAAEGIEGPINSRRIRIK